MRKYFQEKYQYLSQQTDSCIFKIRYKLPRRKVSWNLKESERVAVSFKKKKKVETTKKTNKLYFYRITSRIYEELLSSKTVSTVDIFASEEIHLIIRYIWINHSI